MTRLLAAAFLAFAPVTQAAAGDLAQLLAGTGIARAEAETLTLSEIAALRFNRGADRDQRQQILPRRDAGAVDPVRHARLIAAARIAPAAARGLSLPQLAAAKHNAGSRPDDRQRVALPAGNAVPGAQLMASAGLDPRAAGGLDLTAVAAAKFARDGGNR